MCIAVPARVLETSGEYARVEMGSERKEVRTDMFSPKPGEWVLVFGNQVIDIITKDKAKELIQSMELA